MEPDDSDDPAIARVLEQVLERRLRETLEKFRADIPQILRSHARGQPSPPTPGPEFVRALLEWVATAPRGTQGDRYLLVWYAKRAIEKSRRELPDGKLVHELIRARLTPAEIATVDRAIAEGWKNVQHAGSLRTLASRRWREFLRWLTPEQKKRFAPYLAALVPPVAPVAPPADGAAKPAILSAGERLATPAGKAAIVLGLPALAAIVWFAARGPASEGRPARPATLPPASHRAPWAPATDRGGAPQQVAAPASDGQVDHAEVGRSDGASRYRWRRARSGVTSPLNGVAWSGSLAVAVGYQGAIVTSADGVAWTSAAQPATFSYAAVAYGSGHFVAVGTSKPGTQVGRIITASTDGETWSAQRWADRPGLTSIAHGGGAFVAVGNQGAIVRSTDGEDWQTIASGTGEHLDGVIYAENQFLVVGHAGTVLRSADGLAWTVERHAVSARYHRAAARDGSVIVVGERAAGDGRTQAMVWRSSDLQRWSEHEVPGVAGMRNAIAVNGLFVATSADGVLISDDGTVWSVEVPATVFKGGGDLVWTGAMLIAVGVEGTIVTGAPGR